MQGPLFDTFTKVWLETVEAQDNEEALLVKISLWLYNYIIKEGPDHTLYAIQSLTTY